MRAAIIAVVLGALLALFVDAPVLAQNCSQTSVGLTPLSDLGTGTHQGFEGGLYPGGSNEAPAAHLAEGLSRAQSIRALDTAGEPDSDGAIVLMSMGMSNTHQEFCSGQLAACASFSFVGQALVHPELGPSVQLINGAKGGRVASTWDEPTDPEYDRVRDEVLAPLGLSEAQVQVVWLKVANGFPTLSLPNAAADAFVLEGFIGGIARTLVQRYPNVKMVFLASRIYAGYATTALNPEPYAYETAFGVKWAIEAQIRQVAGEGVDAVTGDVDYRTGVSPWLGWGPYLWADGMTPRSDGTIWECADLELDGTHPDNPGRRKVGGMLVDFMVSNPLSRPWFTVPEPRQAWLHGAGVVAVLALLRGKTPGTAD